MTLKYTTPTIVLLMIILLSACMKNEDPVEGGYICAVMENDHTKTAVTDEGAFTWSAGDKVWLGTTSGSVVGTLSSGAGTSKAEFAYGTFFGEMTGMAVCPHHPNHKIIGKELNLVLPASYDLGPSLANTNAVMYGVNVAGTFQFTHLAGVMRFKFKNVPVGTDKFQITLDKKVNGTFVVNLDSEQPVVEAGTSVGQSDKTIILNFDPLQAVSDISLYIPLPVGTYNSIALDLWAGDQSVWTYSNTVTNTVSRKTLKLMPTITLGGTVGGDIVGDNSSEKYATLFTDKEDELVAKVRDNIDVKTVVFLLISDTHAYDEATYAQSVFARKLAERIGVDAIVHLGDMIDENPKPGTDGSLDRIMRYMEGTASSNVPFLHAIGHHEKYGSVIYPSNESEFAYYLTNDLVAGLTVRRYDRHLNAVHDARNVFNYYVDFDYQQLRCIFVDSVYMRWGFDENTISWTEETINNAPQDYKIMFFSHVPCLAKANFRNTLVNEDLMLAMLNKCTYSGRTILGWSHGHLHGDNVVHSNETAFPLVATTCNINRGTSKDSTSPKYDTNLVYYKTRTAGTIDQYAVDVLCIHPDQGKLNYFRFGVGKDRVVSSFNDDEYPFLGESVSIETSIGGIKGADGVNNGVNIRSRSTYQFNTNEVSLIYSEKGAWYLYAYSGDTYIGILQNDGTFAFTSSTSDDRTIEPNEVIDLRKYDSSYSFRVCGYPDAQSPNKKVTSSTKDMWRFCLL